MSVTKPLFKYNGGQWNNAAHILPVMSSFPHKTYVEHCAGSAGVMLQKKSVNYEILNDIDSNIVNFFRVLQNRKKFKSLLRILSNTPYSMVEMQESHLETEDEIQKAKKFFCRCWMSRSFNRAVKNPSWIQVVNNVDGAHYPSKNFRKAVQNLYDVRDRILQASIDSRDIRITLNYYDTPTTLHYIDLPYLGEVRKNRSYYDHEMLDSESHEEILNLSLKLSGGVIFSGYQSELYDSILLGSGWERHDFKALTNGKSLRTESIYYNPPIVAGLKSERLFG